MITSDTLEYTRETSIYKAQGNVKVQRDATTIEADEMTYSEQTSDLTAAGSVRYADNDVSFSASRVELNLDKKTGAMYDAHVFYKKDNYHIVGKEIRKRGENYYVSPESTFTTCDGPVPAWCFSGKNVDALVGDRLKAKDASFRIKGIPVLYTPYLWAPILSEKKTGFLMPLIGYSNTKGFHLNIPFYWVIAENRDATIVLDEYTQRGLGEGIEYRYIEPGGIKGQWWIYHIRDNDFRKDFIEVRGLHDQRSKDKIGGFLSVNLVNEKEFYREFDSDILIRTSRFLDSTGELNLPFSNARAYLLSQYWTDLKDDLVDPAQRLPEAGYVLNPTNIGQFLIAGTAAVSNFWRDEGIHGQRIDVFPAITHKYGRDITIVQTLGLRETAYFLKNSDEDSPHREALEYSIISHTRLWKKYGSLTHVLEPSIGYTFISNSETSLPVFDSTELLEKTSRFELSLLNRLFSINRELIVLRVTQGFDTYLGDRPFLPLKLEIGLRYPVSMRLDAGYDIHTGKLESINSDLSMNLFGMLFTAGQRYGREDDIQTYVAGIGIHPFKPLYLNGSVWYDAVERETRDIAVNIKYVSQCWGVQLGAVKRPGDFNLTVLFELKGITRSLNKQ